MKRVILDSLKEWKTSYRRKPLLLQGARQVGKTWILKEFAKDSFTSSAYINFLDNKDAVSLFERNLDIDQILEAIEIQSRTKIKGADTLLILDEIQECPEALSALKPLYERYPEIPIVAAGSLLGVALHSNTSFPVGKIDHLFMYPMSFYEYLLAVDEPLCRPLDSKDTDLIEAFSNQYIEALKRYYFIGGMPEAVLAYIETKDFSEVRKVHDRLCLTMNMISQSTPPHCFLREFACCGIRLPHNSAAKTKNFFIPRSKKVHVREVMKKQYNGSLMPDSFYE